MGFVPAAGGKAAPELVKKGAADLLFLLGADELDLSKSGAFVVYLGTPVEESLVERLVATGGTRVPAHNPYWDEHGVTIADPDGYRLVLCSRTWG